MPENLWNLLTDITQSLKKSADCCIKVIPPKAGIRYFQDIANSIFAGMTVVHNRNCQIAIPGVWHGISHLSGQHEMSLIYRNRSEFIPPAADPV